jgi:hypothetical protein
MVFASCNFRQDVIAISELALNSLSPVYDAQAYTISYRLRRLTPAVAAIAYPFLLNGFHSAVSVSNGSISILRLVAAVLWLSVAMAVPFVGLASAFRMTHANPSSFDLRARRLAYMSICAPPFFVLDGVALGLLHLRFNDECVWVVAWSAVCIYVLLGGKAIPVAMSAHPVSGWRVAHGIVAAVVLFFILFHLSNHLLGLEGPDAHAATMSAGRRIYRSRMIEPLLVGLMLFQVVSGIRVVWHSSSLPVDAYRVFQIGSGTYLAAFILTHLNSALVSARTVHKIETGWAWASGAPTGLIHNAWNIRLVPHYAFGVFFVLGHLASGLRGVAIAHGLSPGVANRVWTIGLILSGLISVAIMSGLCGARI